MVKRLIDRLKQPDLRSVWLMIGVVGVVRYTIGLYLNDLRGPLGLGWIFICCPILVIIAIICIMSIFVLFRLCRRTGSFFPVVVLIVGTILVFLPPFPPPSPSPEEELFLKRRTNFEKVVQLAYDNKITKTSQQCPSGSAPDSYRDSFISPECIAVYKLHDGSIQVVFQPYSWYYPIIYEENPKNACNYLDFSLEKQLDTHWYVCIGEWN